MNSSNLKINELKKRTEKLKIFYYNQKGKKDQLESQRDNLQEKLEKSLKQIDVLEEVRILLHKVSEFAREQSRKQIEELVTDCLQFIFDSNIEFQIEINELRGRPEAEFYVVSNLKGYKVKTKPQDARGGGIVDIISLAIRIAMLESNSTGHKGPMILDEPAKHVSDDYIMGVAEFLKHVSMMFDRQIIMVTHNKHLSEISDKCFRVEIENGASRVSEI